VGGWVGGGGDERCLSMGAITGDQDSDCALIFVYIVHLLMVSSIFPSLKANSTRRYLFLNLTISLDVYS
jgi:hypothetical protein